MSHADLQRVIDKINGVYSRWNRKTPLAQMRQDWDELFGDRDATMQCADFSVGAIPCRWTTPDRCGDTTILYIHGGGFRLGSMDSTQTLVATLAKNCEARVLSFNYRLMPEHVFPAQLDDTIAMFDWLLAQGVAARNIVLAGDSAGGNLAAALVQWLKQQGRALPRALVLLSPWLDMTLAGDSYQSRAALDPIHQRRMLDALASEYLGGADRESPLASPLFGDLAALPPTLIHFGGREVGLDDAVEYQRRARAAGSEVILDVWPDMIHVFHTFVGELPEADAACGKIGDFVKTLDRR